ncbi:MAG: hypothetical protein EOP48_26975 [Sphingobacteriales bacterium]|nr:MAG: hypothetical protein EOP48_26975 [Sphingobacteriales bacterium]
MLLSLNTSLYQSSKIPLVDLTGYTAKVDLSIKANLKDIAAFNKALEVYDLKFEERETELDMLLITDRN